MTLSTENILLLGSLMLFISIVASKTSYKWGIPTLVLFLIVGMLAGSDGLGGIYFNDPGTAQFLGIVALTLILFSGGLDTKFEAVKPTFKNGISLSTLGVLLTAVFVGVFAHLVLGFQFKEGMLLGAIVSSTDAAAVFSILRSRSTGLKGDLRPLLEFESGSNDPMAFFLTISFISLVMEPETSLWSMIPRFFIGMSLGAVVGYGSGKLMQYVINRIRLNVVGLYPVLTLSMVFFTFSFTDFIGGNGFLAVYLAGIILGNTSFIHKKSLMRFYDGQAWLMQIVMFLTLGLLVYPSEIPPIMPQGILISLFMIIIARPLAVFISLSRSKIFSVRKKLFISWVGLRGAAPIVFATYPMVANVPYARELFNLVFFISVSSVLIQGTTIHVVAKWLRLNVPEKLKRKFPLDIELRDDSKSELVEIDVVEQSPVVGKAIVELNLPPGVLIVLVHRKDEYLTPRGETILEIGDHLLIMADNKELVGQVHQVFGEFYEA